MAEHDSFKTRLKGIQDIELPCGDALGRTCWKGILAYLGNCLRAISGCGIKIGQQEQCRTLRQKGPTVSLQIF